MFQTKTIIALSLFLVSCSSKNHYEKFFNRLLPALSSTHELKILNSDVLENRTIKFPQNTWIALFEFVNSKQSYCIIYKTPFSSPKRRVDATLRLVSIKRGTACNAMSVESIVSELKLKYLKLKFSIGPKNGEFRPHFDFKGERLLKGKNVSFRIKVPLLNLPSAPKRFFKGSVLKELSKTVKFAPDTIKSHTPGLHFYNNKVEVTEVVQTNFNFSKAVFCHKLNDKCENEQDYTCGECPSGIWSEAVGGKCSSKRDKVCGDFSCDSSGSLACFKGTNWIDSSLTGCSSYLKASLCHKGLVPICVDGYVICQ